MSSVTQARRVLDVHFARLLQLGFLPALAHGRPGGHTLPTTYVAEVVPPRTAQLDALALENLLQSVVLSAQEPVALELWGTATERRLLVRATTGRSLAHLGAQLRAHTPQAIIRPLATTQDGTAPKATKAATTTPSSTVQDRTTEAPLPDPLNLSADEQVQAVQLLPRAGAHLPFKVYAQRELGEVGVDPLLGILAAMDGLPTGARVGAQLALASAPETWSRSLQRLAVEHPLAQERAQETLRARTAASSASASGGPPLLPLLALLGVAAIARPVLAWYHAGDVHHLLLAGAGLLAAAIVLVGVALLRAHFARHAVYNMRLVDERTSKLAARACLTLIAIGPAQEAQAPERVEAQASQRSAAPSSDGILALSKALVWRLRRAMAGGHDAALDGVLETLVAAYRQHALASGNGFVARHLSARRAMQWDRQWARSAQRSRYLLNARELAALWHLPAGDADIPMLERTRARLLLAPTLPLATGYRIGASTHAGYTVPVCLPPEALRHNTLLVAKTGKGKSSLLHHLACAALTEDARTPIPAATRVVALTGGKNAIGVPALAAEHHLSVREQGHRMGLVVVDPHGDLVIRLLGCVPAARREEVVLVDLADTAFPVALNPLDALLGRDRDKAVESLLHILAQIWARFWGPRMQNALEYALKTLYEANEALIAADPQHGPDQQFTLLDVAPILSAPGFRRDVLALVRDQALHTWWAHYYKPLDPRLQLEIINPVLTKMAAFSGSRVARRIVGQGRSTLDLVEIVREGKVLLVNTAKGVVGADTATLVGATLLGALQVSLEEQARLAPESRRRFLVVVDEFQSILGVDYAAMLSELRKFGGRFALATQALAHLDALDPTLRPTVLANVDALYAFAVSADDARTLTRELDEAVDVTDLINQDDFSCYAKLTLQGKRLPVFSLALDLPDPGDDDQAQHIRRRAQVRYARPLAVVDEALAAAAARYLPLHELRPRTSAPITGQRDAGGTVKVSAVHTGGWEGGSPEPPAEPSDTASSARGRPRGRFGRHATTRPSDATLSAAADLWAGLDRTAPTRVDASVFPRSAQVVAIDTGSGRDDRDERDEHNGSHERGNHV